MSIFDQVRPVQFQDPVERQGRLMQLMAMQDQAEAAGMQREQMRRAMAKEGRLAQLAQQYGGDAAGLETGLRQAGMFEEANKVGEGLRKRTLDESTIEKNRADATKERAAAALSVLDMQGRVLSGVVDNPTPERASQAIAQLKSLHPGFANLALPDDGDIKGWAQRGMDAALSAKDRLGKFGAPIAATQNGQQVFIQPNQMGGAPRVLDGFTPPNEDPFSKLLAGAGIDPKSPQGQALWGQYLNKQTTHAPPINLSVNTEKTLLGNLAEGQAKEINDALAQARGGVQTIGQVQRLVSAINSGNVNLGPGADIRQVWDRLGVTMGIAGKNAAERLQNTQDVVKALASANLEGAKALQGQGAVTDFERKLVERASSGDLSMSPQELMVVARVADMAARAKITTGQRYRSSLEGNKNAASLLPTMDVQMPPPIKFDAPSPARQTEAWQIQRVQ